MGSSFFKAYKVETEIKADSTRCSPSDDGTPGFGVTLVSSLLGQPQAVLGVLWAALEADSGTPSSTHIPNH